MTEKAKEARRAYKRKWAAEHPEKTREYQARYWEKRAAAEAAAAAKSETNTAPDKPGADKRQPK